MSQIEAILGRYVQAYQILKRGGIEDDHIVVMHTNDLAGNFMNPHPGQIFNKPGGPDVYEGVPLVIPSSSTSERTLSLRATARTKIC